MRGDNPPASTTALAPWISATSPANPPKHRQKRSSAARDRDRRRKSPPTTGPRRRPGRARPRRRGGRRGCRRVRARNDALDRNPPELLAASAAGARPRTRPAARNRHGRLRSRPRDSGRIEQAIATPRPVPGPMMLTTPGSRKRPARPAIWINSSGPICATAWPTAPKSLISSSFSTPISSASLARRKIQGLLVNFRTSPRTGPATARAAARGGSRPRFQREARQASGKPACSATFRATAAPSARTRPLPIRRQREARISPANVGGDDLLLAVLFLRLAHGFPRPVILSGIWARPMWISTRSSGFTPIVAQGHRFDGGVPYTDALCKPGRGATMQQGQRQISGRSFVRCKARRPIGASI